MTTREYEKRIGILNSELHSLFNVLVEGFYASALLIFFENPILVVVLSLDITTRPDGVSSDDDEMVKMVSARARWRYTGAEQFRSAAIELDVALRYRRRIAVKEHKAKIQER